MNIKHTSVSMGPDFMPSNQILVYPKSPLRVEIVPQNELFQKYVKRINAVVVNEHQVNHQDKKNMEMYLKCKDKVFQTVTKRGQYEQISLITALITHQQPTVETLAMFYIEKNCNQSAALLSALYQKMECTFFQYQHEFQFVHPIWTNEQLVYILNQKEQQGNLIKNMLIDW